MTEKIPISFFPTFLGADAQQTLAFMISPDAKKIIDHFQQQLDTHKPTEDEYEWDWLSENLEAASKAIESGDTHRACVAFFDLGVIVSKFTAPRSQEMELVFGLAMEAAKRRQPLADINRRSAAVRRLVQSLAQSRWDADTECRIRIGEMTDLIWCELADFNSNDEIPPEFRANIMAALPDKMSGLKRWLRKVAPDYAKKPGRPPKK